MRSSCLTISVCLFGLAVFAQKRNDAGKIIAAFDAYVQQALPKWQTPGISIAIVKDGEIIFKKAYGVREQGKPAPFTTATLSACASTTKAMTAVCMGMLVDAGKLKWTDKVADILPAFKINSPFASAEITVLDLFTHNAGLGNADNLWVYGYSREEILQRIQKMQPAYSLRAGFIYQNLLYIVAGEVIHAVSGKTWEQFITDNIFTPLGMNNTYADHAAITGNINATAAHYPDNDTIKVIPYLYSNNIGAAGGVWSCADDMAKWIQCLLDSTHVNGRALLKPASYAAIFKPQVIAPATMYPTMQLIQPHWFTYGLGWFQHDYRGRMVQMHTGSLAGLTAIAGLVPEDRLGIYVFGNLDHAELRHALLYKAIDLWGFHDNNNNWSNQFYLLYRSMADTAAARERVQMAKRATGTHPVLPLSAYTGVFVNTRLATISVSLKDNSLVINMPQDIQLHLEHWQYEVFRGMYNRWWYSKSWVQFLPDRDGRVNSLRIDDVVYTKTD
jgi:CubicO group peptidase (beta-lactamase class C family)